MSNSITRVLSRNSVLTAFCLLLPFSAIPSQATGENPVVLENEHLRLEVDADHGAIARIVDKQGQIDLLPAGGLADNFRLILRSADKRVSDKSDKVILGRNQKVASITKSDSGLDLAWHGPFSDSEGGSHNLHARMTIQLVGSALEFQFFVQNDTDCKVAEAWYPIVGGLAGFGRGPAQGEASLMLPTASPTIKKLAIPFGEMALHYPDQMNMSYSSVYDTKSNRAMYFASHDPIARLKYYRFFEQSSPKAKDLFACIEHKPFTPKGKKFEGSPVVLQFHDGDWKAAGPIYREWFVKTFGVLNPSQQWIRQQSFFQDTMFILPEGTLNLTFKDIPRWAKDARDHGVTSLLISGWNRGGHDNGYPYYEPDPRLGTYDDLKRGLAECHKMGMRVYFFINYQPTMVESDWYKQDLHSYAEFWENGGHGERGFGMGTLWARIGHPKIMAWIDPSFPEYRDALIKQFLKLVEAGADGLHVDKMVPGLLNFNPRCEFGPDVSSWEGPIQLTRQLLREARKINPDFAMSFECNWDRMLEFSGAVWWRGNMSFARSVFPEMAETWAIYSPYDYLGVNDAVRLGDAILLGPLNYSRSIGWEPWKGLADYVQEVKRIRDSLTDAVFLGKVLGHEQIQLGHEPAYGVEYNVFQSLKTNRRVCILTNSGRENQYQVIHSFDGKASRTVRIQTPFAAPRDVALPAKVTIPGERIVFVEKLPETVGNDLASAPVETGAPPTTSPASVIVNGGFESGDFTGWTADPNWRVDRNTCGAYRGWEGKFFAWSGGKGEAATGRVKSKPFVLDNDGVRLSIAGWNTLPGSNRSWNYVMLKSANGEEIDRRTPVNNLAFAPVLLDGSGHKGELVYIEAVDDADQDVYSMFCIDDVRTVAFPPGQTRPLDTLPPFDDRTSIKVENDRYCVHVSRANGAITRIYDKIGNLELIREPQLADNFKFTLPLPGKQPWETIEANYIFGKEQSLSSFEVQDQKLTLIWRNPRNRAGQEFDATITMGIEIKDEAIRFTMKIDNRTPYQIGEVFYPILGGVTGLGGTYKELKATRLVRSTGTGFASSDIFFNFTNFSGLGDQGAEQFFRYPGSLSEPWMDLCTSARNHRGFCIAAHDETNRSLMLHLELEPGNAQTPRWDGNWPRREELGGLPTGVLISFVDFANQPAGKTYDAIPTILQAHKGEAQEAQRIYRKWKQSP